MGSDTSATAQKMGMIVVSQTVCTSNGSHAFCGCWAFATHCRRIQCRHHNAESGPRGNRQQAELLVASFAVSTAFLDYQLGSPPAISTNRLPIR